MSALDMLVGVLGDLDAYTRSEAWETCLGCGCLCKPTETCPGCLVNTT